MFFAKNSAPPEKRYFNLTSSATFFDSSISNGKVFAVSDNNSSSSTTIKDLNNLITYCHDCHFYKIHKYMQK